MLRREHTQRELIQNESLLRKVAEGKEERQILGRGELAHRIQAIEGEIETRWKRTNETK
jgi:hypothetical protein